MTPESFIVLSNKEAKSKFFILMNNRSKLSLMFKDGDKLSKHDVVSVEEINGETSVSLSYEFLGQDIVKYLNQLCYIHFSVGAISYFTEAAIRGVSEDCFTVLINSDVYRVERRGTERLLLYPHYESYVFFEKEKEVIGHSDKSDNVIFFDKKQRESSKKEKIKSEDKVSMYLGDQHSRYYSYRCLDISAKGMSFLIPADSSHQLEVGQVNPKVKVGIVEGSLFDFENVYLISKTDFVDGIIKQGMKKINVEFKDIPDELVVFINSRMENSFKKVNMSEHIISFVNKLRG